MIFSELLLIFQDVKEKDKKRNLVRFYLLPSHPYKHAKVSFNRNHLPINTFHLSFLFLFLHLVSRSRWEQSQRQHCLNLPLIVFSFSPPCSWVWVPSYTSDAERRHGDWLTMKVNHCASCLHSDLSLFFILFSFSFKDSVEVFQILVLFFSFCLIIRGLMDECYGFLFMFRVLKIKIPFLLFCDILGLYCFP